MKYTLELMMNGTTCLDGKVSGATAFDLTRTFMTVNVITKAEAFPSMESIMALTAGASLMGQYEDETGSVAYILKRVKA